MFEVIISSSLNNTLYEHSSFLHRIKAVFTHMYLSTTKHVGRVTLGDPDGRSEHSAPSTTLSASLPLIWHLFLPSSQHPVPSEHSIQPSVICSHSTLYFSFPDVITLQILLLFSDSKLSEGFSLFCSTLRLSFWHDS